MVSLQRGRAPLRASLNVRSPGAPPALARTTETAEVGVRPATFLSPVPVDVQVRHHCHILVWHGRLHTDTHMRSRRNIYTGTRAHMCTCTSTLNLHMHTLTSTNKGALECTTPDIA